MREHTALIAGSTRPIACNRLPRALLMMNCDFDADQPKLYAVSFYRELRAHYAANQAKLQLNIYPAGHTVTPEMERDAVGWFRRQLLGRP